ncbi:MAG: hypothetical protein KF774_02560 [Planctomyces sp.]|nr:hypothetical protein [Planctomyces sp.]
MSVARRTPALLTALLAAAWLAGCSSHVDRLAGVRQQFFRGDLTAARAEIVRLREKPKRDEDVLLLDQAIVELFDGQPRQAERLLRTVRDRFDHLEQKDVVESAKAMLTDDTRLAYSGEDHERILIRAMLALSNLMGDGGDAEAYSLQIAAKQRELIDRAGGFEEHPELESLQVALGPYLRATLQEERQTNPDEVVRNRAMVVSWQPDFRDGQVDLARAESAPLCPPGQGVVHIIAMVGAGPIREERSEIPTQAAMLIADRILSALAKQNVPPTLAPIRVPVVVRRVNRIQHLKVAVDDRPAGETATLVDVGRLAEAHFESRRAEILGRAVARRALKKGIIYGVKEGTGAHAAPVLDFALNVLGVAWEAAEAPDTRCWGLLPDRIQVLRLELPAGQRSLQLTPGDQAGKFGFPALTEIEVEDGRSSYVLVNFPDSHLVGKVLKTGWDEPIRIAGDAE